MNTQNINEGPVATFLALVALVKLSPASFWTRLSHLIVQVMTEQFWSGTKGVTWLKFKTKACQVMLGSLGPLLLPYRIEHSHTFVARAATSKSCLTFGTIPNFRTLGHFRK